MARFLILLATLTLLAGCGGGDPQANRDCQNQATGNMRWGYYPGYGCGPVPPAQTKFS
ncbi:MAG TPA: hypothetical protein VGL83_06265 [Stellaceae bacterium]|jgi:hypothetical protein